MEKIKNLLSPGKDRDNEQLYGTGENTNTAHSGPAHTGVLSGEGSHLASKTTTGHTTGGSNIMPGGYPNDSTTGLTSGTNTNTTQDRVGNSGAAGGNHGIGHSGLSNQQGTVYNTGTSPSTTAGSHSSTLENKLHPRVDADNPGSVRGAGTAANLHAVGYPNTSSSTSTGHSPNLANKADPTIYSDLNQPQAIGAHGTTQHGTSPRSFPLESSTSSSATVGPHSSSLENKLDPRVDSDQSRTVGGQGSSAHPMMDRNHPIQTGYGNSSSNTQSSGHNLGRDASALGTAAAAGSAIHHHQNQSKVASNTPASGTGYDNSTTHTGSSGHHLGRDAAVLGMAGAAASSIPHHQNTSNLGSNTTSTGAGSYGLHNTSGPHQTETANLLDPHVSGGGAFHEDAIHHHEHQSTERNPVAVGGGAEQADSSHRDIGITSADATRIKDTELAPNPELTGNNSSTSHTGRNAALGAGAGLGAAGLASHEHGSHHTGQSGSGGNSGIPHHGGHSSGITGTSGSNYPTTGDARDVNTTGQSGHHGREIAAVGAGLGAAGIAKHEHNSHHTGQFGVGNTHGTPHQSGITGTSYNNHPNTGVNLDRDVTTTGQSTHHGRDATLGAGAGLGAAGLAKHEHDKHNNERSGGLGSNPATVGTTTTTTTHYGHHDNRDTSNVGHSTTSHHGHHDNRDAATTQHGRDAALGTGAGVGAAGIAKHEHGKYQAGGNTVGNAFPTTGSGTNTGATQHDLQTNFGNYPAADQSTTHGATTGGGIVREAEESMRERGVQPDGRQHTKDHEKEHKEHYKEMKKEQKHEQKEHEKELKKEHKYDEKNAHEVEKQEKKDHKGGLFSFLHRDKSKKYTDEEEKEFERQEREHNASQSHHGRNAAGGAALGAGAVGAYEANKHHDQSSDTDKSLPTAPANHGIGTGSGTVNALAGQPGHSQYGDSTLGQGNIGSGTIGLPGTAGTQHATTTQHPGRDATTMTGSGVGTAVLGDHEHNKHYTTSGNQSGVPHSGTHSGTQSGTYSTGQSGLAPDQPRLSEADFDQYGNPIQKHPGHLPPPYGTDSGSDGRNRLHKDPPAGHPAAQAMAGQSTHEHSSTHAGPGRHENLTGDNNGLASDSGVKNAGGNTY